ncbi:MULTISPECIES: hypothetical protein [Pseudanabaena]|uniref:hypothetical protein n=1 Tax=Pseudanabaena TaxID=1152 RepID=UPI00247A8A43|nr:MULTISPECIES: hypothetical protein [Pseudanabaena]MEA5488540.1 hypothetical protein [Pseudanabaena sp. CCNP1317]WGS71940.1 hypothetical protein OA858_19890 [Pseudanabaena galeata CCNP1313]
MFDFIAKLFGEDNRSEIERYIEDELFFREKDFVKFVVLQARFDVNIAEKNWFLRQNKTIQKAYLGLLFMCENDSGKETFDKLGHLSPISPEFKKLRDLNMKKYGLHLWGDELIKYHNPQLK